MKKRYIKGMICVLLAGCLLTGCGSKKTEDNTAAATAPTTEGASYLVKLGNYKNVEVTAINIEVTDEDVQDQIDWELSDYAPTQEVEGRDTVEYGDVVNIDFAGDIDGVAFDGGTGSDYDLEIGSQSFIDDFEDQLIAAKVGDLVDVYVTFPDNYGVDSLNGAEAHFAVTINSIQEYISWEMNDEFCQEVLGFNSVEEYRGQVYSEIYEERYTAAQDTQTVEMMEAIIADSEFSMDEAEVEELFQSMYSEQEMYASYYGMDLETYVSVFGYTMEEFEDLCRETAEFRIQSTLVVNAVTEDAGITMSDDEYQEYAESLMLEYGYLDLAEFEEAYTKDAIVNDFLYNKTIDYLLENVVEI